MASPSFSPGAAASSLPSPSPGAASSASGASYSLSLTFSPELSPPLTSIIPTTPGSTAPSQPTQLNSSPSPSLPPTGTPGLTPPGKAAGALTASQDLGPGSLPYNSGLTSALVVLFCALLVMLALWARRRQNPRLWAFFTGQKLKLLSSGAPVAGGRAGGAHFKGKVPPRKAGGSSTGAAMVTNPLQMASGSRGSKKLAGSAAAAGAGAFTAASPLSIPRSKRGGAAGKGAAAAAGGAGAEAQAVPIKLPQEGALGVANPLLAVQRHAGGAAGAPTPLALEERPELQLGEQGQRSQTPPLASPATQAADPSPGSPAPSEAEGLAGAGAAEAGTPQPPKAAPDPLLGGSLAAPAGAGASGVAVEATFASAQGAAAAGPSALDSAIQGLKSPALVSKAAAPVEALALPPSAFKRGGVFPPRA